jgi:signal transduction histidine kinase
MTTLLDVMGLLVLLWAATRVGQMKLPPSMRTITWILVLLLLALHAADIAQAVVLHTSLPDEVSDVLAGGLPFVWASLLMQMAEVLAERRAQATRDQLGFFFSEVPAGVLVIDSHGVVVARSVRFAAEHPAILVGDVLRPAASSLPPQLVHAMTDCLLRGTDAGCAEEQFSVAGQRQWWRWAVRSWASPDANHGVVALVENVTAAVTADAQRVQQLAQLAQAQSMALVGQLAAGAVHDLNNLLLVLQLHLATLHDTNAADANDAIDDMNRAVTMASGLTRSMLRLARAVPGARTPQLVAPIVEDTVQLLGRTLPHSHSIHMAIDGAADAVVDVDPDRLRQLVLNLVVNARDAMVGGRIEVVVRRQTGAAVVTIEVSDHGTGIDDETKARLFEPFFSTKGARGTGLGLGVVRSVVDECHGTIDIASTVGEGTRFTVMLPCTAQDRGVREAG